MSKVSIPSIDELLEAGAHFGHVTSRWHPKMEKFLYGKKGNIHIIDLKKTQDKLSEAVDFCKKLSSEKKHILFVGVKPMSRQIVQTEAERSESPYMVNRWIGGTLTNRQTLSSMLKRVKKYEDDKSSGRLSKYTKREQLEFEDEYNKLMEDIGGIRPLKGKPGALFIVDVKHDNTALAEANKLKIPVIAISDSNVNPLNIQYPIPANDDAYKSVSLITRVISDAVIAGRDEEKEKEQ